MPVDGRLSTHSGHWLFSIPDVRAPPFGRAMLVTPGRQRTRGSQGSCRPGL